MNGTGGAVKVSGDKFKLQNLLSRAYRGQNCEGIWMGEGILMEDQQLVKRQSVALAGFQTNEVLLFMQTLPYTPLKYILFSISDSC